MGYIMRGKGTLTTDRDITLEGEGEKRQGRKRLKIMDGIKRGWYKKRQEKNRYETRLVGQQWLSGHTNWQRPWNDGMNNR